MPQESIYYALGRLSVLEKNALDDARIERLLQATSVVDARKALTEIGWSEEGDYETLTADHVQKSCRIINALTTDHRLTDAFLLRYDVNNLKTLLKARCLGTEAGRLSACGTIPVDTLRHAVADHNYHQLPVSLRDALNALENRLSVNVEPLDIDVTLDKALYRLIFETLPKGQKVARSYFAARVDMLNAIMAMRALNMKKDAAFLKNMLIEGGSVPLAKWVKTFSAPDRLPLLLREYGVKIVFSAQNAQANPQKLPDFERAMDDYLLKKFIPYRRSMDKDERLVGYLLMREREAAAVRLIMAGKINHFPPEAIKERLRELYA